MAATLGHFFVPGSFASPSATLIRQQGIARSGREDDVAPVGRDAR